MVASLLVEKVGRRRLFLISTTGMLVAFILWTSFAACKFPCLSRLDHNTEYLDVQHEITYYDSIHHP